MVLFLVHGAGAQQLSKKLKKYMGSTTSDFEKIDPARKESLEEISDHIFEGVNENREVRLVFICTHNSRRSHMGQVLLSAAAVYYDITGINVFSGGTEATAVHPNAIAAMERAGFKVSEIGKNNPRVTVSAGADVANWVLFSKKYDHPQNPKANFGAVMVCSDADKSCPVVPGADFRVAIPYDDPRYYDETPAMEKEYDKTLRMIATEMLYVAKQVKKKQTEISEMAK